MTARSILLLTNDVETQRYLSPHANLAMLIRIVRMHFTDAGVDEFLQIFNQHRYDIRNFPGCSHLQLLKDTDDPLTYTTFSHWDNAESLQNYRKSELFGRVWGSVKSLFSERSMAFSMEKYIEL